MATRYTEPLGAAYRRMKAALFQPFDLGKWFAVGFASWIAGWGSGGGFNFSKSWKGDGAKSVEEAFGSVLQDLGTPGRTRSGTRSSSSACCSSWRSPSSSCGSTHAASSSSSTRW